MIREEVIKYCYSLMQNESDYAMDLLSMYICPEMRIKMNYNIIAQNFHPKAMDFIIKEYLYYILDTNNNMNLLCKHPHIMKLIRIYNYKEGIDIVDWDSLSMNSADDVVDYLLDNQNIDKINWATFSQNTNDRAIKYLIEHPDNIDWASLSMNSNPLAVDLLKKNKNKIHYSLLSLNKSKEATELLEKYMIKKFDTKEDNHQVNHLDYWMNPQLKNKTKHPKNIREFYWDIISSNPYAISILKRYPNNISLMHACTNKNSEIAEILEKYIDEFDDNICWENASANKYLFEFLKKHQDKIYWNLFTYIDLPEAYEMIIQNLDKLSYYQITPAVLKKLFDDKLIEKDEIKNIYWGQLIAKKDSNELYELYGN